MSQSVEQHNERLIKVSGVGQDRPGIVYRLARIIRRHGGNVLRQRSLQLAGDYAITLVASFANGNESAQNAMRELHEDAIGDDFIILSREIDTFDNSRPNGTRYGVTISGPDRMGILESMTLYLLQNNLNLESVESDIVHMPFQGTTAFRTEFWTRIPPGFDIVRFSAEIEQVAREGGLTIRLAIIEDAPI